MAELLHAVLTAQAAAGADITTELGESAGSHTAANQEIAGIKLTAPATVTGVATNNATISVRRYRAGVLVETTASITLAAGVNLPAHTAVDVPVTGSPYVQAGDVFEVLQHQNGTGLALPAGIGVEVEIV